jgi:hypothetical protein
VLVDKAGALCLIDMGISWPEAAMPYQAPERGPRPAEAAHDMWAMGTLLLELALGRALTWDDVKTPQAAKTLHGTRLPERLGDAIAVLVVDEEKRVRKARAAVRIFEELGPKLGDGPAELLRLLLPTQVQTLGEIGVPAAVVLPVAVPATIVAPEGAPTERISVEDVWPQEKLKKLDPPKAPERVTSFEQEDPTAKVSMVSLARAAPVSLVPGPVTDKVQMLVMPEPITEVTDQAPEPASTSEATAESSKHSGQDPTTDKVVQPVLPATPPASPWSPSTAASSPREVSGPVELGTIDLVKRDPSGGNRKSSGKGKNKSLIDGPATSKIPRVSRRRKPLGTTARGGKPEVEEGPNIVARLLLFVLVLLFLVVGGFIAWKARG